MFVIKALTLTTLIFNELMDVIKKESNNMLLIMGDFNFPAINWVTLEADVTGASF